MKRMLKNNKDLVYVSALVKNIDIAFSIDIFVIN